MTTKPKRLLTKTPEITQDEHIMILCALGSYAYDATGERKLKAQDLYEKLLVAEQITVLPETPQEQL